MNPSGSSSSTTRENNQKSSEQASNVNMNKVITNTVKSAHQLESSSYQFQYEKFSSLNVCNYSTPSTSAQSDYSLRQDLNTLTSNRHWKYTEIGKMFKNNDKQAYKMKKLELTEEERNANSKKNSSSFKFTLCTYNLLAPDLLSQNYYLYAHLDPNHLDWNKRRFKILNEIKRLSADIYCFQEMNEKEYYDYFFPRLKGLGYTCFFKKRYGDSKSDGCVVCFKSKKFKLVKKEMIDFYKHDVEILNRENVGLILLLRTRSDSIKESKYVCIATTHILYNPKRGDCKLAQIQLLLAHLDKMAFKKSKIVNNQVMPTYHPTILCGDFNCSQTSKIYEFLSKSKLPNYKDLNRNVVSGQFEFSRSIIPIENTILPESVGISDQSQFKEEVNLRLKEICQTTLAQSKNCSATEDDSNFKIYCSYGSCHLRHTFQFKSAYNHYNENNEMEVTSCIKDSKKIVDYIFYHSEAEESSNVSEAILANKDNTELEVENKGSFCLKRNLSETEDEIQAEEASKNQLELLATLELFTENELNDISLPNHNYPSDHFLLAAKFSLN